MLGSAADAEDMLQETFIRWRQAADDDVRSPRAFLVTIITRLCINQLQSARVQREEYIGEWLPEPLVTDPQSVLNPQDRRVAFRGVSSLAGTSDSDRTRSFSSARGV